ncbi:2',3'-cyclic-nucleotide 2'-phosphodiesterase [Bacillus atrophaeus]|uniref:2',3'-cyclic-nucleotide 2'-phosphodiesterase n=1 Tax=Bacillus atrophaeus TaxID=1452 RepID=UPI00227E1BE4|nr:2',3'-cyclic-nucleotide 2'-phosphodiesterase [Bacillus atrophaeus]MCY8521980.1 2',3'-cyclic-nucleotide 2'-phosphodiesterase [Bacillus atrophaeus]MCY8524209.1 2',3'-cyclic-nucleotide 2'-phosphodiesterase [Bacillus atrophaeus]MDL5141471.1 2',3'-cyclic-nucleotide 2'-phosphodiesterase [Bacillus atrophaeus]
MRILFIGDVVGSPGRDMVKEYVPKLKTKYKPHFTIINGENAAHGKGLTEKIYHSLMQAGADAITMGNHTWDKKEIFDFIDEVPHLVRPANFPEGTPGKGITYVKANGKELAVINLQGRTFLPPLDDPFQKVDELIAEAAKRTPYIFIDFHAEATSEKLAIGWYTDGRASAVVGTHTHVQTADNRILPKGTAYITDVGMTGPYDGILGMDRETIIKRFKTNLPVRFSVAEGKTTLSGVVIDIDDQTKKAVKIERILINDDHMFFE